MLTLCDSVWDHVKSPGADQIVTYESLTKTPEASNLNKLAVLKVNGGLGTSMGACPLPLDELGLPFDDPPHC